MTSRIIMNPADIRVITEILREQNITGNFELIHDNSSGIGYNIDLEFDTVIHGRTVKVRVPVCTEAEW
jgi:hypothetical protein